jgi:hypothetical protein
VSHKVNTFRDGKVHVLVGMCATCVFRPGNKMRLSSGRLKDLVAQNTSRDSALTCHTTLDTPYHAVCRGFYDKYKTTPLQLAERLDMIEWQDVPKEDA